MQAEPEKQKRCGKCKEEKALTEFHKDSSKKDGLQGKCKACAKKEVAKWHEANREKKREYMAKWHESNREEKREYMVKWRKENPDYYAKYRKANPEKIRVNNQRRRARKRDAEGSFTADEWKFTLKVLDYRCIYCGTRKEDTPEGWLEAEHLTPLSRGGTNYIDNIVPSCRSCNLSKGTKTFDEYLDYLNGQKKRLANPTMSTASKGSDSH